MAQTEYLVTIGCVYIVCTRKGGKCNEKKKGLSLFSKQPKKIALNSSHSSSAHSHYSIHSPSSIIKTKLPYSRAALSNTSIITHTMIKLSILTKRSTEERKTATHEKKKNEIIESVLF